MLMQIFLMFLMALQQIPLILMQSCGCHSSLCHRLRWCGLLPHQSLNQRLHLSSYLWLLS